MYTYAFLPSPNYPLSLPSGIAGSLQLVQTEALAALVEPNLTFEALQADDQQLVQAVLAHDRIIRDVFQQTSVLPLRFGTQFVSQQGLLEHMGYHSSEYLDKLADLRGKAEYTLKFTPTELPEPSIPADLKGRDYFLAKKQAYQTQAELQQQQQTELQQIEAAIAQAYPASIRGEAQNGIERIHLLSDRQQEAQLLEDLSQWQSLGQLWELTLGEGLPPYHFV